MTTSKSTEVDLTVFVLYFIKIEKTKNSSQKNLTITLITVQQNL